MATYDQDWAIKSATELAEEIGHAAAVIRNGRRYSTHDSWKEMPDGWQVVWLVSTTGKVVRQ